MKKNKTIFTMLRPNFGGFSFNTYFNEDGEQQSLTIGYDKYNRPVTKRLNFAAGVRSLPVRNGEKDLNGKLFVDHIRESPFCEGSLLCPEGTAVFKELNPAKDAEVLVNNERLLFEAKQIAFGVEGKELDTLAAVVGCHSTEEGIKRKALLDFATHNPQGLIEANKANDKDVVADVKSFVASGVIKKKGFLHEWVTGNGESVLIATSEKLAVKKFMEDKKLYKAVKDHHNEVLKSK
jgi:hypothetical protein